MSRVPGFRESLAYCSETCPDVDRAFSNVWDDLRNLIAPNLQDEASKLLDGLCEAVKEVGTEKLRAALCSAVQDKEDAEGERASLQRENRDLEARVDDLQRQVESLEVELSEVSA